MGYVDTNLLPGETVAHRAALHWVIYARPIRTGIVGAAVLAGTIALTFGSPDLWGAFALGLGASVVLLFSAAVGLLEAVVRGATSEFAVTNKRVIVKTGFVSRDTLELNLAKVETVGVQQSVFGRLLGYGTIVIVGTGGTRESFRDLATPMAFRRAVDAQAGKH
ncbi:MAG: PH domain-containing protein [Planctomycetota bacterium]|nr:PH domain-containing protein [Planctomycetota bacterium]